MKIGDLVWVVGHPRDGLQMFLAVIVALPDQSSMAQYTVIGCESGTTYKFFRFELETLEEHRRP